ncbi:hypothetical protein PF011_g25580 [Phytophthora fragariae]|uniref:Uncharacterized protein n=1 Tax=Phytophthora fragariae TaxID=53985 RepID=A0A6A3HV35_9STRA|nr:hypothetical protein PF011_g25580 [Phytophthora fragariae]
MVSKTPKATAPKPPKKRTKKQIAEEAEIRRRELAAFGKVWGQHNSTAVDGQAVEPPQAEPATVARSPIDPSILEAYADANAIPPASADKSGVPTAANDDANAIAPASADKSGVPPAANADANASAPASADKSGVPPAANADANASAPASADKSGVPPAANADANASAPASADKSGAPPAANADANASAPASADKSGAPPPGNADANASAPASADKTGVPPAANADTNVISPLNGDDPSAPAATDPESGAASTENTDMLREATAADAGIVSAETGNDSRISNEAVDRSCIEEESIDDASDVGSEDEAYEPDVDDDNEDEELNVSDHEEEKQNDVHRGGGSDEPVRQGEESSRGAHYDSRRLLQDSAGSSPLRFDFIDSLDPSIVDGDDDTYLETDGEGDDDRAEAASTGDDSDSDMPEAELCETDSLQRSSDVYNNDQLDQMKKDGWDVLPDNVAAKIVDDPVVDKMYAGYCGPS